MIGELLKVGDVVVINIPDENWSNGYRPVDKQKGSKGIVTGFGKITYSRIGSFGREPGVYTNHSWVTLNVVMDSISTCFLELEDQEEYKRRYAAWNYTEYRKNEKPIAPLPEMDFWEGDIVSVDWNKADRTYGCPQHWAGKEMKIASIKYNYLGQKRNDGSPMPEYDVTDTEKECGTCALNQEHLTLVRRGNVWKYYNGEKPVFKDLNEEAAFFAMLGHTDEVRNPASNLYSWNLKEMLAAIRSGIVDGFTVNRGIFGTSDKLHHNAQRFRDRELGERVRAATIEGFKDKVLCDYGNCCENAVWEVSDRHGRSSVRCEEHSTGKGLKLEKRAINK